jgi:hypothetical protein
VDLPVLGGAACRDYEADAPPGEDVALDDSGCFPGRRDDSGLQEKSSMRERVMTTDEMFESAARSKGDLAGVFEYDGETGYFYLYNCGGGAGQQVVGAIRILSGEADFEQTDITVRWDGHERKVGLFIRHQLCAIFDADSGAKYGGNYRGDVQAHIPPEELQAFK